MILYLKKLEANNKGNKISAIKILITPEKDILENEITNIIISINKQINNIGNLSITLI